MLPLEHSAILLTCIKLTSVLNTFVLSILEWLLKAGLTVQYGTLKEIVMTQHKDNKRKIIELQ